MINRALAGLAAVLVLAACGPAGDGPTPVGSRTGAGPGRAAEAVLRLGNGAEPQTLDPHRAEGVPESDILRDLYEGLVGEAPDGSLVPGAAESWAISDEGLVYTFTLRADARWSNGDPVTAGDFEFGLRRSIDPATLSRYSSILFPVVNAEAVANGDLPPEALGVRAVDERTLEIRLNAPTPYLLGLLTHSTTYPVHRPSLEAYGDRFARPGKMVGNGAYQLTDWMVQSHVRLDRNPYYWDAANAEIDTVYYYAIENPDAELKRYRADELDITEALPYNQLTWVRENLGDQLVISPYLGSYYFGYNLTRPPFENAKELRTALAMAIDREILAERVTGAGEIPAYGWVPPVAGYAGQQPDWASWTQAERNARAQELYSQAGYSVARPLRVEILYNTNENHKRISVAIASMWKQVLGVETSLVNQEWKVFLETRNRKTDTEVFRAGWIADYNDAYSFAQLMHSNNEQNDSGYNNPVYDELLDRASQEQDPAERAALMEAAERVLLEDLPIIPIYFYVSKHLVKPWVVGFTPNIMDHHATKDLAVLPH
jgi:oligopeptide transport system substrate-binding protein